MLKTKDGLDLFTQSWKVPDPKALLVLTHGYNDHSGRFAHVGQALNAAGFSLYTYDLRGHGRSGGQRGHTLALEHFLDDLALIVANAAQAQPGRQVFLYGHSMGGNITLNYALRRLGEPTGLGGVLVTGPWLKLAFDPPAIQLAVAQLASALAPGFSQKSNIDVTRLSRDLSIGEAYRNDPLLHGMMSARLLNEITAGGLYALEHASRLKLPVLLLHGADDKVTSAAATRLFFERAGAVDKTLKLYADMRHEIHNEFGKEEVLTDIIAWLDKHLASSP